MANELTDTKIKAAKPKDKPYKLSDGGGLHLLVTSEGRKLWRFRYRQPKVEASNETGKRQGRPESTTSFGPYPNVSLADARKRRDDARKQLAADITPVDAKRAEQARAANTFKEVAQEWLALQTYAPVTMEKAVWTFDDLIYPYIGKSPVDQITAPDVLALLRRLESRGKHETAHRTKSRISQVLRYAIATGRAVRDPTADLRGALKPHAEVHRPSIKEPTRIGELMRAIDGYAGQPAVEAALKLAPLVFVRPGELRSAEWKDFTLDGDEPLWRIPGARMKRSKHTDAPRDHIVPLAPQAVAILRGLHPFTGSGRYVFPSLRSRDRPISDAAVSAALRRMGYGSHEMTWHGFRSMASTNLNELGFNPDHIEAQLAHSVGGVRGAYNAARWIKDRREMMIAWANYLDGLKADKSQAPA